MGASRGPNQFSYGATEVRRFDPREEFGHDRAVPRAHQAGEFWLVLQRAGPRGIVCGRWEAGEEGSDRDVQNAGDLVEPAGAHVVEAAFVFLNLLIRKP